MIVIGLLLILVAAGAVAFVLMAPAATSQAIELTAVGVIVNATPLASFFAGAAAVVLLGLGFALVSRGTRRKASSRAELRHLRKEQATAGANTAAVAGERSSHRDRPHNGSRTDTSTDSNTSTSTDSNADSEPPAPR